MLRIENLSKSYGDKKAVEALNVHIAPGEIYGFIGHNGAGKTTTIKCVCGLLPFEQGDICINGHSIKREPLLCKKDLAYIPDDPQLYSFMTGIQYLNFIGDIFEVSSEERTERIARYTRALEIEKDLNAGILTYSHGMKQKLALVSALLHDPKLILMDEPFVGLDPKASHSLKLLMHEHCERGGSIFFSTHVLDVAEKLCHKVAIIQRGQLIRCGTMEEVKGDASLEQVFLELAQ